MKRKRILAFLTTLALVATCVPASPASVVMTALADDPLPIYKDVSYSFEERAADLVAQMTLAEKASQLVGSNAAAIPRLGLSQYQWWNEAIHGFSRNGGVGGPPSTMDSMSYPVSYAVGATWDPELYYREATEIGDEIRESTRDNNKELTYYSPTVNLARDPRWGRNDESYSEDPYLTGVMASQFIAGMEGKDPETGALLDDDGYYKTVTTIKHYTANNSEVNRRDGGAETDIRAVREYYTRPYRNIIKQVDVSSVMTAYSNVNEDPVSYSSYFMDTLLRQAWGFSGYITSDCDSVSTITNQNYLSPITGHNLSNVAYAAEAFAMALAHGEDLECNNGFTTGNGSYFSNMSDMILGEFQTDKGLFTENQVDVSVHRLMTARVKLGELDGETGYVAAAKERLADETAVNGLARQTQARLELAEDVAENAVVMLKNEAGALPVKPDAIEAPYEIAVIGPWAKGVYLGGYTGSFSTTGEDSNFITILDGLKAAYADNSNVTVTYYNGFEGEPTVLSQTAAVSAAAVAAAAAADLAIVVLGNEAADSAEESDRASLEFSGKQADLALAVGAASKAAGHKSVVIMETYGPMDVSLFKNDVDAILWSAFAGIRKGVGFASVVAGEKSPSGKTTALWHNHVSSDTAASIANGKTDLPPVTDYIMYETDGEHPGRTYMYYNGAYNMTDGGQPSVTYPFGYGLSYAEFSYGAPILTGTFDVAGDTVDGGALLGVQVDVENQTAGQAAEEVVQLYISQTGALAADKRPAKRLFGFEKREIAYGTAETFGFTVPLLEIAYFDEADGVYKVDEGTYKVEVGGNSIDAASHVATFAVTDGDAEPNEKFAIREVPLTVTFKPNQAGDEPGGDKGKWITERVLFDRGVEVKPNIAVAMNNEKIYGRTIENNVPQITEAPSIVDIALPASATVTYSSNRPSVVAVSGSPGSQTITTLAYGVATITATVAYNGVTKTGDFIVYVQSNPAPDSITIDGAPLAGFAKWRTVYSVGVPYGTDAVPALGFTPQSDPRSDSLTYAAVQASAVPGRAVLTAADELPGGREIAYDILFGRPPISAYFKEGPPPGGEWEVMRPDSAAAEYGAGGLTLTATSTTAIADAKNLYLQPAAGSWEGEAHVTLDTPPAPNASVTLFEIYQDDDNYIGFAYNNASFWWPDEFGVPTEYSFYSLSLNTVVDGVPAQAALGYMFGVYPTPDDFYIKVTSTGDTYGFQYSYDDGATWANMGKVSVSYFNPRVALGAMAVQDSIDLTYEYITFDYEGYDPLKVAYSLNGGQGSAVADGRDYYIGAEAAVKPIGDATKPGTVFLWWNTAADGSGTTYRPGDAFAVTADTTLYAQWGRWVSFDMGGGTPVIAMQGVREGGHAARPANPAKGGYIFLGWYLEGESRAFDFENTVITSDITLNARWRVNGGAQATSPGDSGSSSSAPPSAPAETPAESGVTGGGVTEAPAEAPAGTGTAAGGLSAFSDAGAVASWARGYFERLVSSGVISGRADGTLDPKGDVTRAEFTKMVVQALNITQEGSPKIFSTDVKVGDWYKQYVDTASAKDIVQGLSADSFGPNNKITRQDICVIMHRALNTLGIETPAPDGAVFPDNADVADYAKDAVNVLKQIAIVSGRDDGRFDPRAFATREETAKIICGVADYAESRRTAAPEAAAGEGEAAADEGAASPGAVTEGGN